MVNKTNLLTTKESHLTDDIRNENKFHSHPEELPEFSTRKNALIKDANGLKSIINHAQDMARIQELEAELFQTKARLEVANNAKSEFLAVISHEFRIPLTSILGMANLLSMQNLSTEIQREYVQHISNAGMHLLNLINDMLDFANLEAGKVELTLTPMDLNALIEETCTMFTPLSKAKNLELLVNVEHGIPHQILADKRALRQIIINLVGNAIKFTEHGYVSLQVECIQKTMQSARLLISVTDTGIGISRDKQEMIFDHFSQVDSSHSRHYGGTGLGLTITKLLVELMNGTIHIASQLDKGSTFYCEIEFPLVPESNLNSPWMPYQSGVRILIVDDTRRGEVIRKQISPSNSQVVPGKEALDSLLASYQLADPYDIVIIDQKLMGICAYELAETLCKHGKFQTMLILLANDGLISTKNEAKKAGFFESIVKPIHPIALQVTLTAAWERWIEERWIGQN
jgi:signal transduction histidine kinase/CheY-like chemotaxis protein